MLPLNAARRGSIAYGIPVTVLDMNTSSPRDAVLYRWGNEIPQAYQG